MEYGWMKIIWHENDLWLAQESACDVEGAYVGFSITFFLC